MTSCHLSVGILLHSSCTRISDIENIFPLQKSKYNSVIKLSILWDAILYWFYLFEFIRIKKRKFNRQGSMIPHLRYCERCTKDEMVLRKLIFLFQLSLFSQYQFDFRLFIDGNFESFNHLFLHNWQSDYSDPVQRVPNPYAVFHIDDFYQSVNYAVTRFERHL